MKNKEAEAVVTLVITKTMTIKPWEVADALGGEPSDDEIREYLEDAAASELGASQMHVSFGGTESFEDAVRRECDVLRSDGES